MRQEYSAGSAGFILGSLPRCKTKWHQTRSYAARLAWRRWGGDKLIGLSIDLEELHSASRALEARVDEALAGNQELQSYVQRLDSGLVDEDQEPPDELNYLTEDDLPSEIPSSDVALRELEEFLRQNQQDPGPNSGSDDPSDSA
jgi:hypothetical protein